MHAAWTAVFVNPGLFDRYKSNEYELNEALKN
jgi:hypothetical protein